MKAYDKMNNLTIEIINDLQDENTLEVKRFAVLRALTTNFDEEQEQILSPLLFDFIIENKSNEIMDVAVGVAIHKYIGILPISKIDTIDVFMNDLAEFPNKHQLSIVKMITRKLIANYPLLEKEYALEKHLSNIVSCYIHFCDHTPEINSVDRAILLNLLLSLRLLRSKFFYKWFNDLKEKWFIDIINNRINKMDLED